MEGDDDGTEAHKNEEEPLEEKHAEALEEAEDDRKRQLPRLNTNGRRDFRGVRERGFAV